MEGADMEDTTGGGKSPNNSGTMGRGWPSNDLDVRSGGRARRGCVRHRAGEQTTAEGARWIAHYLADMQWLEATEPRGYAAARALARLAGITEEIEATLYPNVVGINENDVSCRVMY